MDSSPEQAIGWWDYDETEPPTLINRFSAEKASTAPPCSTASRSRAK